MKTFLKLFYILFNKLFLTLLPKKDEVKNRISNSFKEKSINYLLKKVIVMWLCLIKNHLCI